MEMLVVSFSFTESKTSWSARSFKKDNNIWRVECKPSAKYSLNSAEEKLL